MRFLTILGLGILSSFQQIAAQTVPSLPAPNPSARLSGKLLDIQDGKALANGTVLLLGRSDSILVTFAHTDKTGGFSISSIPTGKYILLVSYPTYADYVDELEIHDSAVVSLPPIGMIMKSKLLDTVMVSGSRGAIRVKGDTLEFKADSFQTRAGATVEELLKKLPGIEVDRNGGIKAQGKSVEKVLVDGEEFFSDDPTLVTQNLHADMVDKVQLYDKKSDQANFTGIDDGQRTKTINLKLKDDKKNGYFGKLSGSAGTNGYHDAQAMFNKFRGKEKLAGYGILSNTGKTGLDWGERDNYGQSIAGMAEVDENTGSLTITGNIGSMEDWSGKFEGQGLPSVRTGGAHYNNKWDDDKLSVNGNYKFMDLRVDDTSDARSEYIVPDSFYFSNSRQVSHNEILRHSFDGSYEVKFDSTSSMKIMTDGGMDHKTSYIVNNSELLDRDNNLVNQNDQRRSSTGDYRALNSNFLWKKKLGRPGRTVSVNFRENYNTNTSDGYLYSDASFYTSGIFSHDSVTDQYKKAHSDDLLLDGKIVYTEPLSQRSFLGLNYGLAVSNSHSDLGSYNRAMDGKYSLPDPLFSNNYEFNTLVHKGGVSYSYIRSKLRFSFGSAVGLARYTQRDLLADTSMQRVFTCWYPQAGLSYSFSANRRFSMSYSGSTTPPSLYQIQPARTNENALNITLGNPGLKPQFYNSINMSYADYKILTERNIWVSVYGSYTGNSITSSTDLDLSTGKSTTQYVNLSGNYNISGNFDYDFKWQKPKIRVGINCNTSQSSNNSILNDQRNTTLSSSYGLGLRLARSKDDKYDISFSPSGTYTESRSSLNSTASTHYLTGTLSSQLNIYLPHKLGLAISDETSLRQKTAVFTGNNNVNIVNISISKKLITNDALQLVLSANDVLKQNIGFSRSVSSNFISQNTYATIQRYFMFTVSWNFTKMGGSK